MLAIAQRALAQLQLGDLTATLSGSVSGGYTADFGNLGQASDHGFTAGGNAALAGSFYSPNFLSYSILPFYNQSRTNSDFQSIIASSGVTAGSSIFSGSNFPGSIGYSKIFNSSGNFGVPGVANYTSFGNSDSFNVGWSENVANLPHISVGFQEGTSDYSIYGASSEGTTDFHSFNANLSYLVAGFNLTGSYRLATNQFQTPQLFESEGPVTARSDTSSYSVGIGHALPFNGNFSASANRADINFDSTTGHYDANIDSLAAGMTFTPIENLHVGANAQYLDNLEGTLYQPILAAGGTLPENVPGQSSHSLDVDAYENYEVPSIHMSFTAVDDHRDQTLFGEALSSDSITGVTTYSNALWGGFFNATGGVTRTTVNPSHASSIGGLGSVNFQRPVRRWKVAGSLNYSLNQQTLLIAYTTSSYGYSGSLSRKFSRTSSWTSIASGSKSELAQQAGSGSFSQSYASSFNMRWLSASGSFTRSDGNSVLTPNGLASPSTLLPVVGGTSVILYGGHAYSASIGATPIHGLTLAASYSSAISNTQQESNASSRNMTKLVYARVVYLVRKVYFQAGYTRLDQSFSGSGGLPVVATSLYVGLSRWFNFF